MNKTNLMRYKEPGETVESFMTTVHTLAEHFYYGVLKEVTRLL